jgi:glutaminyl-peptide cyclotransferase
MKPLPTPVLCSLAHAADTYRIVHTYPHDPNAYTQGLVFVDGHLYESTGLNGRSTLRMDDLETGRTLQSGEPRHQYFAEGLTDWGSTLIQLTWQSHIAFVYDRFSFRLLRTLPYSGEGWGLTQDGKNLILSTAPRPCASSIRKPSSEVRTRRRQGKRLSRDQSQRAGVHSRPDLRQRLAHRPHRPHLARNRQGAGLDRSAGLLAARPASPIPEAVLNGIAYDAAHDRLFVTGKLWPKLFEIKIVPEHGKNAASQPCRTSSSELGSAAALSLPHRNSGITASPLPAPRYTFRRRYTSPG